MNIHTCSNIYLLNTHNHNDDAICDVICDSNDNITFDLRGTQNAKFRNICIYAYLIPILIIMILRKFYQGNNLYYS